MSSESSSKQTNQHKPQSVPGDVSFVTSLKRNPVSTISITIAALTLIAGIAAIIAIDTMSGKIIGGILFCATCIVLFVIGGVCTGYNGIQIFVGISAALSLAIGAGVIVWVLLPAKAGEVIRRVVSAVPASIIIDNPIPGSMVSYRPDIYGSITNLGVNQDVWMFSQPYSTTLPYKPIDQIGPYEQCAVSNNRVEFKCPQAFNGSRNGDYCRMALLWVSIVNSGQINSLQTADKYGTQLYRVWPNPPYSGEGSDSVLVQRGPAPGQTCPSVVSKEAFRTALALSGTKLSSR